MHVVIDELSDSTSSDALNILPEVYELRHLQIEQRRWFHQHPELAFQEFHTAARVAAILEEIGLNEVYKNIGKTGVVGIIRGELGPGPCIALRADMDALAINETAEIDYKSCHEGVMHACGHDGHMAGLLTAARILHEQRHSLRGIVKLIFQPAEEGLGGAREMLADGVLDEGACGPRVDCIYGIHINTQWSMAPLGTVQCSAGPVMAASDKFAIHVGGKGGHGAAPHNTVDAIVEAAALVTALQTIVSRNKDPLESGVLTCGTIKGGYGYNIIADAVTITGTCRSFTSETQEMIKTRMHDVCCGVAQTYGGQIALDYQYGYPATVNAYPTCVAAVNAAASAVVGGARAGMPQRTMGAEDFSYYLQQVTLTGACG